MKAVLVTTKHRGVFFGYITSDKKAPEKLTLKNARNCIYWAASVGGFLGLAAKGPNSECRIGTRADELTIYEITSIAPVSESAAKAWEDAK